MTFRDQVFEKVKQIPKGKVASYGQIAALAGSPRASRQVGWALASLAKAKAPGQDVPWWRVVNSKGYLSIRGGDVNAKQIQKKLLEQDGVPVDQDFNVDMEKYGYRHIGKKSSGKFLTTSGNMII